MHHSVAPETKKCRHFRRAKRKNTERQLGKKERERKGKRENERGRRGRKRERGRKGGNSGANELKPGRKDIKSALTKQ